MGLFDSIFGKNKDLREATTLYQTLTAYEPVFSSWHGKIYESDLVRAAINARAIHASKLRFEWLGSGQQELQTRLKRRPNQFQTWSQFIYRCSTILDVQNTLFIVPVTDKLGDTIGIYPVIPRECRILDYHGDAWLEYEFSGRKKVVIEFWRCGIMTKFQYKDDFFGEDNKALADTMSLIDIQHKGIREAVKASAAYKFMAKVNNFTKAEDLKKERERFDDNNLTGKGGGLLLFPNTYSEIKQIDAKNYIVDADQMKQINENVYKYYGVNDDILKNQAYGDKWNAFYESAIEPFAIQFSEVLTAMLLTEREQATNQILLTSNRLQYLSNTEKLSISSQLLDRGVMNVNEVREIWNLSPLPGDAGEVYRIRAEYISTEGEND